MLDIIGGKNLDSFKVLIFFAFQLEYNSWLATVPVLGIPAAGTVEVEVCFPALIALLPEEGQKKKKNLISMVLDRRCIAYYRVKILFQTLLCKILQLLLPLTNYEDFFTS